MPATAARAQFVSQETRLSAVAVNTSVEAAYGDLARNTDDGAFDTLFSNIADVEHAKTETATIVSRDSRVITQSANLTAAFPDLNFDTVTPALRAIDRDLGLDRVGLVSKISRSLISNTIELETWG